MARILIVEDAAEIRQLLQVVLEAAGHVVEAAQNGAEGLQRYTAAPADLVILDMRMPILDGRQFILALRRHCPHAAILAVSGEPALLASARALHVQGTLHKPFAVTDLLVAVQQWFPCRMTPPQGNRYCWRTYFNPLRTKFLNRIFQPLLNAKEPYRGGHL